MRTEQEANEKATSDVISNLPWIIAFGVGFISIVFVMTTVQQSVLAHYDAADQEAWQQWKRDAGNKDGRLGPVQRREPKSDEPPGLVLLRDHFPAVVISILVFYTCMFGFALFLAKGMARHQHSARSSARGAPADGMSSTHSSADNGNDVGHGNGDFGGDTNGGGNGGSGNGGGNGGD
jgi:hypothetical protein